MLHFATMCFGFLTEYVSTPKYADDTNPSHDPVGPDEFAAYVLWAAEPKNGQEFRQTLSFEEQQQRLATATGFHDGPEFRVDYLNGRNALKIISQDEWEGDRPSPRIREDDAFADGTFHGASRSVHAQRCSNYVR